MADQRRYTDPEINKYLRSGERATEDPWYTRYGKQAAIAIPEALLDTFNMVGQVAPDALVAGANYAMSDDPNLSIGEAFRNAQFTEKGAQDIDLFKQQKTQEVLSQLPDNVRSNPAVLERVNAAIEGSREYSDFVNSKRGMNAQMAIKGDEHLRRFAGIDKTQDQDTWADEAVKLVASSIVPSKWLKLGLEGAVNTPKAVRIAGRFIEPFLPGNTGSVANAALNIGVGEAISEPIRYAADLPGMLTGDPMMAEQMAPEAPQVPPPFQERPVNQVVPPNVTDPEQAIPGLRMRPPNSDVSIQTASPTASIPIAQEQHGGLGGDIVAAGMMAVSAAGVLALAYRGRSAKGIAGEVTRGANTDMTTKMAEPTAHDASVFGPVLTTGQKVKAGAVDKRAPIADVVRDAYRAENDIDLKNLIGKIERQNLEATTVEIHNKMGHSWNSGYVPNLGRNTYAPKRLLEEFNQLGDIKKDVNDAMILQSRMADYVKGTNRLQEEIDDLSNKMRLRTVTQGRNIKLQELAVKRDQLKARLSEDAMLNRTVSVKDARAKINALQQNPQALKFVSNYRKIIDDYMEADVTSGHITREDADRIRAGNTSYVPLIADPYEGRTGPWKWGAQAVKGMAGRVESKLPGGKLAGHTSMYSNRRTAIAEKKTGTDEEIEHTADVMTALHNRVYNYHHFVATNNAKKTFADAIIRSPRWGRAVKTAHPSVSVSEYNRKGIDWKTDKNPKVFSVVDNGMIHFFEAADEELALALRYNPGSAVAGLANARRLSQQFTTGSGAPWFAPVTAIYEAKAARATLKRGRVLGPIHAAFPDSKIMQYIGDPALIPSLVVQSLRGITDEGMRVVGNFLAGDLKQSSTLFHQMDQQMGQGWTQKLGQSMIKSYNESWTAMMREKGILGGTVSEEVDNSMLKGFDGVRQFIGTHKTFGPIADMYLASMESIRNSTKYGFFVNNYRNLHRKYNGRIPDGEIDSLVYDTKTLSGDMTKARGWGALSMGESVTPYASVSINSTAHVLQAFAQEPLMVGSRIFSSAVLPKAMWIGALTAAVPGFSEWFWDDLPAWERMKKIPVIGPSYLLDVFSNGPRPPTVEDVQFVPSAPEFTVITEPFITSLRAAGAFGAHGKESVRPVEEWGEAISSLVSVPANPLLTALSGGQDIDLARGATGWLTGKSIFEPAMESSTNMGMSATGETTKKFQEGVGALFGTSVKVAMMGLAPFAQEIGAGNPGEAFVKLFSYPIKAGLEQAPDTGLSPLYQTREQYRGTEQRARVSETLKKAEEVTKQISVQKRDARTGGFNLPGTQDRQAREMMDDIRVSVNTGMMNSLKKQRSDLNAQIARVEENRDKMSPSEFYKLKNILITDMHGVDDRMEFILEQLNARLTARYGTDLDGAIDYIGSTVQ